MIKRDKRNIEKHVIIVSTSIFGGRKGIVKGFRGDHVKGDPYVNVYLFDTKSIWPFAGSSLMEVNEND